MLRFQNPKATAIRHFWLYALALEHQKYYVGITARKNPYDRLQQHGGAHGAKWTRLHKPLRPLQVLRLEDLGTMSQLEAEAHEQAAFEEFRTRYGLRNVRGGRVTSRYAVYRIGSFYFNKPLLDAGGVAALLLICALVLWLQNR